MHLVEMLFWAGVEAENWNVNQGETTECRRLRDSDLCDSGLQCLSSVKSLVLCAYVLTKTQLCIWLLHVDRSW